MGELSKFYFSTILFHFTITADCPFFGLWCFRSANIVSDPRVDLIVYPLLDMTGGRSANVCQFDGVIDGDHIVIGRLIPMDA